jgi:bacterioferritin-associated ferredoxin
MTTVPTTPDEPLIMIVNRCVCFEKSFLELKLYADEHEADLRELRRVFKCGQGCGLCLPYLKEMLDTGRTSFPIQNHASGDSSV